MSGQFPLTPTARSMTLTQQSRSQQSEAHNLRTITRSRDANRWIVTAEYEDTLTEAELWPLYCFALKQKGRRETFTVILPSKVAPRGVGGGTPVINTLVSAGALSIPVSGFGNSLTVMEVGDVFTITGNTKVYMATSTVITDAGGSANIEFYPPLLANASAGKALTTASVPFTVRFATDNVTTQINAPLQHNFQIALVEDVLD